MADGSDAIADWPLLNAMVNVASGASWVSIHDGGGVGIGRSLHAGQVCVADGTTLAAAKLERVLTNDPAMGVIRHVDAGYPEARQVAAAAGRQHPDPFGGPPMTVRVVATVGHPILREWACPLSPEELEDPGDAISHRRPRRDHALLPRRRPGGAADHGVDRIAAIEVHDNPRYPYKPDIPLTVIINPEIEPLTDETFANNEGCLSVPGLRGVTSRFVEIGVRAIDRRGRPIEREIRGLSAVTFQHEVDHLNGTLFVDRVDDPTTFTTWEQFERFERDEFAARAARLVARFGS